MSLDDLYEPKTGILKLNFAKETPSKCHYLVCNCVNTITCDNHLDCLKFGLCRFFDNSLKAIDYIKKIKDQNPIRKFHLICFDKPILLEWY
jgi:hypothetical protein